MAVRTGGELAGLAVLTLAGGERLGRIADVVLHTATGRITGFLVDSGGLFSKSRFLPAGHVQSLGTDALTIRDADALLEHSPAQSDPAEVSGKSLDGRPVVNEAGTALGKVAGILVDDQALTVPALLLATGLLDNALHGKPHLPWEMIRAVGEHSIIVLSSYEAKDAAYPAATQ